MHLTGQHLAEGNIERSYSLQSGGATVARNEAAKDYQGDDGSSTNTNINSSEDESVMVTSNGEDSDDGPAKDSVLISSLVEMISKYLEKETQCLPEAAAEAKKNKKAMPGKQDVDKNTRALQKEASQLEKRHQLGKSNINTSEDNNDARVATSDSDLPLLFDCLKDSAEQLKELTSCGNTKR